MRTLTLSILLLLGPTIAAPNIIEYATSQGFTTSLQTRPRLLVAFTSRTLVSVQPFNTIFTQSSTNTSTLYLSIDCNQEVELCREHDINSFPTIRLLERDGGVEGKMRMTRYRGPRTQNAIRSFVRKRELPVVTHIQADNLASFKVIDDVVVLAYLRPDQTELLEAFRVVAQLHHLDYIFGYTTSPTNPNTSETHPDTNNTPVPSIICYKNFDADHHSLPGPFAQASIESFLAASTPNVIKTFREKDLDTFMQPSKLTCYIFTTTDETAKRAHYALTQLARKYERYVVFGIVDAGRYEEMAKNFLGDGGDGEGMEEGMLVMHAPMNDHVFRYQAGKPIGASAVERMLTTILQGKAVDGQVFGADAEDVNRGGLSEGKGGHDEL
ncbi:hypothetical protein EK21DRAFT_54356 [Setomelanomma holmii]|uniref:Thioredoxin domain-containing protein n=1 Tax=Setomelanomma holmii TaxID=210430 RepID=A0A9P4LUE0_9PLEO|nr:hypothetical protein EK21DRAFT_54356 [Setomelanomma holmii]